MAQQKEITNKQEDEVAVKIVVESFVAAAGDYNFIEMEKLFAPNANIGGASLRDGEWYSYTMTLEEFINVLKAETNPRKYKEPISKYTIHIDKGMLAFVRANASIVINDKAERTNFDYFTLIKLEGQWKIINGSYVSVPFE